METEIVLLVISAMVKLIPSKAMDPFSIQYFIIFCGALMVNQTALSSFLIFTIKNYFSKFVEKETTPKYYFNDNGLLNLFLNKEEPRLLENLVAINLWNNYKSNVYYLKSQNLDVDFFIEETGTAIQVAYSITNISDDRETKSLVEAAKSLKEAKEFVIITYEEEKELNMDGVKIQVIPVWKWLLKI